MNIKRAKAAISRRLDKYESKALATCGHAELEIEAAFERERLMDFIESKLAEALEAAPYRIGATV